MIRNLVLFAIALTLAMVWGSVQTAHAEVATTLLEEKIVLEGYWYPDALFSKDGTIILMLEFIGSKSITTNGVVQYEDTVVLMTSPDSGRSWKKLPERSIPPRNVVIAPSGEEPYYLTSLDPTRLLFRDRCILKDGSYLGVLGNIVNEKIRVEQKYKPCLVLVRRASNVKDLASGNYEDDFSRVTIPNLAGGFGDARNYGTGATHHALIELKNGALLMSMHGNFSDDTVPVSYRPNPTVQYRSWVCISFDKGYSWSYLSTIASPNICKLPPEAEGFCEPDVIQLASGDLLAVMRTGGSPTPGGERYTPLYQARSRDNGVTWEERKSMGRGGVMPRLLQMSNGKIVCVSGRPGVFFVISEDDGESWGEPIFIEKEDGSSGYTSIGEIAPGVLCIFYDYYLNPEAGDKKGTKMRTYKIE